MENMCREIQNRKELEVQEDEQNDDDEEIGDD